MFLKPVSLWVLAALLAGTACKKSDDVVVNTPTPSLTATVSTIAGEHNAARGGSDGQGSAARFRELGQMVFDARDNKVYVIDDGTVIRSLDAQNKVTTYVPLGVLSKWDMIYDICLAPGSQRGTLLITTKYDKLYRVEPNGETAKVTLLIGHDQGNATGDFSTAQLDGPQGITSVGTEKAYMFNTYYNTLHRLTFASNTTGVVEPFAGKPLAHSQDPAYDFQDGQGESATFGSSVSDLCADGNGNLFVADYDRNTIRKVTPTGLVTSLWKPVLVGLDRDGPLATVEAHHPKLLAIDQKGNLYFTTVGLSLTSGSAVRAVINSEKVVTLAGKDKGYRDGEGKEAAFNGIGGIAAAPDGKTIFVADAGNNVIRRIDLNQ